MSSFAVASIMPFVVASFRANNPLRAYLPPSEEVAQTDELETYMLKDAKRVAEIIMVVESKKSVEKMALTLGLRIPPKANRPAMAKMIAEKLCDFSNEPDPEDRQFSMDDFLNPIFDDIDNMNGADCELLQKWCLAVVSKREEVLNDINETIFDEATGRLRHIHQMLDTPSRGLFAPKVLEKLTGCAFNGVVVKEVPSEIRLHELDETNLFSFQISGSEIVNPIKVISNMRSTGKDLMDYFEEEVGLSRQMFRLTWSAEEGSSQLVLYQSLRSQLDQDKVIYLQLTLRGGGGYVRKTIMKTKGNSNLVNATDKDAYDKTFETALTIATTGSFNIDEGLKATPLADLRKIQTLIARDNTTVSNASKMGKIHEHMTFYKDCKDVAEKMFSASEKFREMVACSMNGMPIEDLRQKVAVAVAVQEHRASLAPPADVQMISGNI